MFSVSDGIRLRHPIAEVFPLAADPLQHIKWDAKHMLGVSKLDAGPMAQGTRYRARFRWIGKLEYKCVDFKPESRSVLFADTAFGKLRHLFQVEAIGEGTLLTQTLILDPSGPGRILSPVLKRILGARLRMLNRELRDYLGKAAVSTSAS